MAVPTVDPMPSRQRVGGPLGAGVRCVHMIGIAGAGMEPLAHLLKASGYRVTGSDQVCGRVVDDLRQGGIAVHVGHAAAAVRGADLVVYSAAVDATNAERRAAAHAGIPQLRRAEVLGLLSRACHTVAVAGTHGKTSTASLIAAAAADRRPAVAIGGWVGGRTQARRGDFELLVAEADEYDRSFLQLTPTIAVVTNIESEHLDCYAGEADLVAAFAAFLRRTRDDGAVVVNGDDPRCVAAAGAAGVRSPVTFGFDPGCQVRAEALRAGARGAAFEVVEGERRRPLALRLPGRHNVANALAAWAAARCMDLPETATAAALEGFAGVDRRFQLSAVRGVCVVDDYAHHPTAVAATLTAARERSGGGRVVAVFQPHTYSRTRHFAAAFARSLAAADRCWVTAVFPAREVPGDGDEGDVIVAALRRRGRQAHWEPDAEAALMEALATCQPGDWLVVMGAGDIGACLRRVRGAALGGEPR